MNDRAATCMCASSRCVGVQHELFVVEQARIKIAGHGVSRMHRLPVHLWQRVHAYGSCGMFPVSATMVGRRHALNNVLLYVGATCLLIDRAQVLS